MKKAILPLLLIVSLGYIGYLHKDDLPTFKLKKDRAELVLNANFHQNEIIDTFYNETYGTITLRAGYEPTFGFRHILARHTKHYFINYTPKNELSLFPDNLTGSDIIDGLRYFYTHCVDAPQFNFEPQTRYVYIGFAKFKDKRIKCLLVVDKNTRNIITFYPFDEREWKEELEVIRDMRRTLQRLKQQVRPFAE